MEYSIPLKCMSVISFRFLFFLSIVLLIFYFYTTSQNQIETRTTLITNHSLHKKQEIPFLNKSNADCARYKFKSNNPNLTHTLIPIYDFFVFHDELDILEIRLYENYNYVTFFLIAESSVTFSGKDKPFYLKENWSRFAKYHDKIRRIEVELERNVKGQWSNEHRMREEGLRLAKATINHTNYILLTSDADEIPKARFMQALSQCSLPDPFPSSVLVCDFYYYSYEFRSKPHVFYGSTVTLVTSNQSNSPSGNSLRNVRTNYQHMESSCFHCSWCFNELKEVRLKMASYSHREHNEEKFRSREHIINRYQNGKDLFDRHGEEYIYIKNNTELPQLVKLESERFKYMTERSHLLNAGFIDA